MADNDPQEYVIAGQPLRCQVCSHGKFHQRSAQLNTAAATFFGLDWANQAALCFVCSKCGYIHWFLPQDE
jgi:hypothetical protein